MSDKSDPLYAIGYEHGLGGLNNDGVDSKAYVAGQKAGSEARAMFMSAGFEPLGNGSFAVSFSATPAQESADCRAELKEAVLCALDLRAHIAAMAQVVEAARGIIKDADNGALGLPGEPFHELRQALATLEAAHDKV